MTDEATGAADDPAAGSASDALTDLVLRRVEPSLWRAVRAVRLAMLLDMPRAYGSTFAREVAFTDEEWVRRMSDSTGWLAYRGEQPVGAVTLFQEPDQAQDEACLVAMWVASHARGSGVVEALVGALVAHARASGLRRVVLDVAVDNVRASRAYQRLGFVPTGRTGTLTWDDTVEELEMALDLSAFPVSSG